MRFYLTRLSAISLTLLVGVLAVWLWSAVSRTTFEETIYERPVTPPTQESNRTLGWDLTYKSVLERNYVPHREWIWKWLNFGYRGPDTRFQTPAEKWIAEWQGEPIVSSILIEFPAGHAGEHINLWFVRTENHAYYWELVEDDLFKEKKRELMLQEYDDLFAQVSSMQQAVPLRAEDLPTDTPPEAIDFYTGYAGFLSLYDKGNSRQMLLTWEDFGTCDSKVCCKPECKTLRLGRLFRALEPTLRKGE